MNKQILNWYNKHCQEPDKFDIQQEVDKSLSYQENVTILTKKLKENGLFIPTEKEFKEKLKQDQEDSLRLVEQQITENMNKTIEEWRNKKPEKVKIGEYRTAKHLIKIIANKVDNKVNALLLTSKAGYGKTFITLNTIKECGFILDKDYKYFSGKITPFELYNILYKHRDMLIVLDDCENIFQSEDSVSVLKSALQDTDGKRLVFWNSSRLPEGTSPIFEFFGRLIILCNKVSRKNDLSVKAVVSRTLAYELDFNYKQKLRIFRDILENRLDLSKEQRNAVYGLLKQHTGLSTKDLNIRTMEKAVSLVKYKKNGAEKLFKEIVEENREKREVWELMHSNISVKEQICHFIEKTGQSRATFFRIKKELINEVS